MSPTITGAQWTLLGIAIALTLMRILRLVLRRRFFFDAYLSYTWLFFISITVAEFVSFAVGVWLLLIVCFSALREYFSLIDIRLQDRLGILGAYLSIPFMIYFIQIDWYGMFIISVPVYSFLAVPLLVALGGNETRGTVFSIGAIVFGLFLFVFCMGHIGYLMFYSRWMAAVLILNVVICDMLTCLAKRLTATTWLQLALRFLLPLPPTVGLTLLLSDWTEIPVIHSIILGSMIPILVMMGHRVSNYVKADLGIEEDLLIPGRGQIIDNLRSLFFVAPVMFHYIRYFLK